MMPIADFTKFFRRHVNLNVSSDQLANWEISTFGDTIARCEQLSQIEY